MVSPPVPVVKVGVVDATGIMLGVVPRPAWLTAKEGVGMAAIIWSGTDR